jgi:hypothetical protein
MCPCHRSRESTSPTNHPQLIPTRNLVLIHPWESASSDCSDISDVIPSRFNIGSIQTVLRWFAKMWVTCVKYDKQRCFSCQGSYPSLFRCQGRAKSCEQSNLSRERELRRLLVRLSPDPQSWTATSIVGATRSSRIIDYLLNWYPYGYCWSQTRSGEKY